MLTGNGKSNTRFERLRQDALELLEHSPDFATPEGASVKELIQELQVHQAELMLQNEELKSSQQALARISQEYQSLYQSAPCGYITLNPKGIISRINQTALDLLGKSRIQLGLSRFSEFIEAGWDELYYGALKNSGQTEKKQCLDLKLGSKEGKERWVYAEIQADRNGAGHVQEWKVAFMDISQKVMAEAALQESQERFKTLFQKTPIAYQSLDEHGNLIEVSDSWIAALGYERKEVIGNNFASFLPPNMRKHFKENFPEFKAMGEILGVEFDMVRKDDSVITVSFHGKIGKTRQGEFKQTHCVFSDITEQKKIEKKARELETKLRQAQRLEAIGVLAGGIAHDFNNILQPIIGFSELILGELPPDSALRDHIEQILKGSMRAAELVRQILHFSSQRQKPPEPILVQNIVRESTNFLRSIIPSNIELYQEIHPEPIYIRNDPAQLYEVAMNLCTNAYQAMEKTGGLLSVHVKEVEINGHENNMSDIPPGKFCSIAVTDTGVGIPKQNMERIFDPYFTTKEVGKGSGLGLSVVHGIVKEHKGHMIVQSEPGNTRFEILFPVIDASGEKEKKHPEFVPSIGEEKILFVDDEPAVVKVIKRGLDKLGYQTTGMTSSEQALKAFKSNPETYDLVISDVSMPWMAGTTLIQRIRQIRPDIPVILCTGFPKQLDDRTIARLNINAIVSKPILIDELSSKIRTVLKPK